MDARQDDFAPAGSSDTGGTPNRATHDDSRSKRQRRSGSSLGCSQGTTVSPYRVPTETARMRQDVVFRVGARLGKIKLEELDNASTAVCGNVLRFIRTFEQCI
jgi:hypothetical protein